jgi:hypothetical protein
MTLAMAGVSILSNCDCSLTSLDPAKITSTTTYTIILKSTDPLKSIAVFPDTVSSVCGLADGITKCGLVRVISFTEATNPVTFPINGFTWNAATSILTLDPASALPYYALTATVSVVSLGENRSQVIMATVNTPPSTPAAPSTSVNTNISVTISWVAPLDGGSPITGYIVAIRDSSTTYTT